MASADMSLFKPELCFFDWTCESADELFCRLDGILREGGYVNEGWLAGITAREDSYPTGLRTPTVCCAIPHTEPAFIERPYVAIIRPVKPVVFNAMAGMGDPVPAEIIVNLGILRDGGQVEALQNLMNIFMDEEKTAAVMEQKTGEGLVETIVGLFE